MLDFKFKMAENEERGKEIQNRTLTDYMKEVMRFQLCRFP